jgi:hypothetical protein
VPDSSRKKNGGQTRLFGTLLAAVELAVCSWPTAKTLITANDAMRTSAIVLLISNVFIGVPFAIENDLLLDQQTTGAMIHQL